MTSKIRFKLGALELEFEGSENFLKDELTQLLTKSRISTTRPSLPRKHLSHETKAPMRAGWEPKALLHR